jgi:hypothetical protein
MRPASEAISMQMYAKIFELKKGVLILKYNWNTPTKGSTKIKGRSPIGWRDSIMAADTLTSNRDIDSSI